jgi:hypothetical protein
MNILIKMEKSNKKTTLLNDYFFDIKKGYQKIIESKTVELSERLQKHAKLNLKYLKMQISDKSVSQLLSNFKTVNVIVDVLNNQQDSHGTIKSQPVASLGSHALRECLIMSKLLIQSLNPKMS